MAYASGVFTFRRATCSSGRRSHFVKRITRIGTNYLNGIGRLRDEVTFDQARAELDVIFKRLAMDYPETNAETGFSFFRQRDEMSPRYRLMLLALCGASLCMLLLTCANLANLLLARAAGASASWRSARRSVPAANGWCGRC